MSLIDLIKAFDSLRRKVECWKNLLKCCDRNMIVRKYPTQPISSTNTCDFLTEKCQKGCR